MDILIADRNELVQPGIEAKTLMGKEVSARRFSSEKEKKMFIEFAKFIAEEYKRRVIDAVKTQKYKGLWKPLSPGYLEYKKKHHLSTRIWEASGTLIKNIAVGVMPNRIIVGVSRYAREPGTGKYCYEVAKEMEYGTLTKPARPLFGPVKRDLEKDMSVLFAQWILENYGEIKEIPEDNENNLKEKEKEFGSSEKGSEQENEGNNVEAEKNENMKRKKIYSLTGKDLNGYGTKVERLKSRDDTPYSRR